MTKYALQQYSEPSDHLVLFDFAINARESDKGNCSSSNFPHYALISNKQFGSDIIEILT